MKCLQRLGLGWRLGIGALGLGMSVAATAAVPSGEPVALANGGAAATVCAACHGASGQGLPDAGFPRLAGLPAAYLVRQLVSYADATRVSPVMTPIAKRLSAADRRALGTYYAGLPVTDIVAGSAASAPTAAVLAAGESLARHGRWSANVPACAQCHGAQGLGVGDAFPQIAGQSATYLANQLQAWRSGTRKNDPMGLMHGIALRLSEPEANAVAAYYASLPATPGDARSAKP